MNRDYQVSFCKYCINSTFDDSTGIVCGLKREYQNFTEECVSFKVNLNEIKRFKKKRLSDSSNFITFWDIILHFFSERQIDTDKEFSIKEIKFRFSIFYVFFIIFSILISIIVYMETADIALSIIAPILIVLIPIFSVWIIKFSYQNKNMNSLIISRKGICVNGEFREWNKYVGFYEYREKVENSKYNTYIYKIDFEFIGKLKNPTIILEDLKVSKKRLIEILNEYEKNYAQQVV